MKKSSCGSLGERKLVRQKPANDGGAIFESPTVESRTIFLTGNRESCGRVLMAPPSPSLSRARSAPEESPRDEINLAPATSSSAAGGSAASGGIGGAGSFDGGLLSMPPLFASSQCYTATAVDCRRTAMSMSGSSSPSRSGLLFGVGGGGAGAGGVGGGPTCSYRRRGSALSCSGSSSVSISFGFGRTKHQQKQALTFSLSLPHTLSLFLFLPLSLYLTHFLTFHYLAVVECVRRRLNLSTISPKS